MTDIESLKEQFKLVQAQILQTQSTLGSIKVQIENLEKKPCPLENGDFVHTNNLHGSEINGYEGYVKVVGGEVTISVNFGTDFGGPRLALKCAKGLLGDKRPD